METLKKPQSGYPESAEATNSPEETKNGDQVVRQRGNIVSQALAKDLPDSLPPITPKSEYISSFIRLAPNRSSALEGRTINMDAFNDVYDGRRLTSDKTYADGLERKFWAEVRRGGLEALDSFETSKKFEQVVVTGISSGNWLGNRYLTEDDQVKTRFRVSAHQSAKYDDYVNRADTCSTITFSERSSDGSGERKLISVPLAIDVTTSSDIEIITNKLTKHYNDSEQRPLKLPFGFTKLDYYAGVDKHGSAGIVPRYVVAVNNESAGKLIINKGNPKKFINSLEGIRGALNDPDNLEAEFKVLAEMHAENDLYFAMLPDKTDGLSPQDTRKVEEAKVILKRMDWIFARSLRECAKRLIKVGGPEFSSLEDGPEVVSKATDLIMEKSEMEYNKEFGRRADRADPFCKIILTCRAMKASTKVGTGLDEWRTVRSHGRGSMDSGKLFSLGII
ncbi:MAG: hypothetical protein Q4B65_02225 [Candidatus Saccharibacteria bacterium]|nr:hypothetical protein [Candidatus Saccharibacteria bacterium]